MKLAFLARTSSERIGSAMMTPFTTSPCGHSDVERIFALRRANGADPSKSHPSIKGIVTHHQGRAMAHLFVLRLRIEANPDEITSLVDVHYQPSSPKDGPQSTSGSGGSLTSARSSSNVNSGNIWIGSKISLPFSTENSSESLAFKLSASTTCLGLRTAKELPHCTIFDLSQSGASALDI
jgi:hypothetical protein